MKRVYSQINTHQSGFSLIEIMIALVIGLIMILGVTEIFLTASRSGVTSSDLARVQESGRIALELVSKEVRRAGYKGCVSSKTGLKTGGITYPDQAITGAADTITVNYARLDAVGGFPERGCDNQPLAAYQVTFSNCGDALCIQSNDSGGAQQLTANTQMAVTYGRLQGNNIIWGVPATAAQWTAVHAAQVALTVTSPQGDVSRTFSSTIDLRNRL
ncbi:MAG: prepilin-type N-terminal cleavage/methylation domain-containing protein [Pseudomonadaceae bacterium]|nr:prepilin-type N-terminal cleavage/methylation domain-containing protein [Pseudomonadaceae bacterium]